MHIIDLDLLEVDLDLPVTGLLRHLAVFHLVKDRFQLSDVYRSVVPRTFRGFVEPKKFLQFLGTDPVPAD
ncbi:hypothetical protein D3C86_2155040 [compost metagenome]